MFWSGRSPWKIRDFNKNRNYYFFLQIKHTFRFLNDTTLLKSGFSNKELWTQIKLILIPIIDFSIIVSSKLFLTELFSKVKRSVNTEQIQYTFIIIHFQNKKYTFKNKFFGKITIKCTLHLLIQRVWLCARLHSNLHLWWKPFYVRKVLFWSLIHFCFYRSISWCLHPHHNIIIIKDIIILSEEKDKSEIH